MSRTKPDRRIARTRLSLHQALNKLILRKGYDATTISDIVSLANVGRSTFYAHHGGKEGLLLSGLQHLHAALLNHPAVPDGTSTPVLGFSRVFFEHVYEYREIFRALVDSPAGPVIIQKMKRMLADVVRNDLRRAKVSGLSDDRLRDAATPFAVDALFSILLWWFEHCPKLPPVEVDAIFRRLVLPGLVAA